MNTASENFCVGISLDGSKFLNSARKNWGGEYTFSKAKRGLELLKNEDINYYLLSVISSSNVEYPLELLRFWRECNPNSVCINIEEEEGNNVKSKTISYSQALAFWESLFQSWSSKPEIRIREFDKVLSWILKTCDKKFQNSNSFKKNAQNKPRNIWPTISWNGDIFIISPEFMSITKPEEKEKFSIGNILNTSLNDVIKKQESLKCLSEFERGIDKCRKNCSYFSMCGGGQASNKYFEHGRLDVTETKYCINVKKALVDGILNSLSPKYPRSSVEPTEIDQLDYIFSQTSSLFNSLEESHLEYIRSLARQTQQTIFEDIGFDDARSEISSLYSNHK